MRKLPSGELEVFLSRRTEWAAFETKMQDFMKRFELERLEASVPKYPALKKEQQPQWNAVWSINFQQQEPCVNIDGYTTHSTPGAPHQSRTSPTRSSTRLYPLCAQPSQRRGPLVPASAPWR